ncbi:MAG TPA: Wzz/FepE/Etk N-terminal domain-containing protein [Bacteroidales bacterium]|nr:Wzz/FepE/Etk N-terminal domain-containing protein [Bacteroidales bacterium]
MDDQKSKIEDPEIDLLELVRQLWAKKGFIVKITAIAMVVGLVVAFSIPREYTCTVKMAPEGAKSSITGDMSSIAAMAGINIGVGNSDGLSHMLYPDVVQSMPFITELIHIPANNNRLSPGSTLYNYLDKGIRQPWWRTVLASPFKLIDLIRFGKDKGVDKEINPFKLTKKQDEIFTGLKKRIGVSIDKKTGIITAGVTMQDPVIAAVVADSLVSKLERYVIDYRTNKARQDLDFALKIFSDSKQEYYDAQKSYARYIDNNKNVVLESVLIEQERLKNEQVLAYNVYSSLVQQVEKAKMKVQEQTPCLTVIEPARIPVKKSNTSRLTILFTFCFFGGLFGVIKILFDKRKYYLKH